MAKEKSKHKPVDLDHQNEIIHLILEDHKPLQKLLSLMKDSERSLAERKVAFKEFAPLLLTHAKSEEEVLYTFMKKNKELREEAFEGNVEHTLAEETLNCILTSKDEDLLGAQIKVLAELVEHHIKEEEDDLLPDFKKEADIAVRIKLGERYLEAKDELGKERIPRKKDKSSSVENLMQH